MECVSKIWNKIRMNTQIQVLFHSQQKKGKSIPEEMSNKYTAIDVLLNCIHSFFKHNRVKKINNDNEIRNT
jgi:hypothetical protein